MWAWPPECLKIRPYITSRVDSLASMSVYVYRKLVASRVRSRHGGLQLKDLCLHSISHRKRQTNTKLYSPQWSIISIQCHILKIFSACVFRYLIFKFVSIPSQSSYVSAQNYANSPQWYISFQCQIVEISCVLSWKFPLHCVKAKHYIQGIFVVVFRLVWWAYKLDRASLA